MLSYHICLIHFFVDSVSHNTALLYQSTYFLPLVYPKRIDMQILVE